MEREIRIERCKVIGAVMALLVDGELMVKLMGFWKDLMGFCEDLIEFWKV